MDSTLDVASLTLATHEAGIFDYEIPVEDTSGHEGGAVGTEECAAPATSTPFSMKDLFGAHFHLDEAVVSGEDPLLLDTSAILQKIFGEFVTESDLMLGATDSLIGAMRSNREALDSAHVESLFGAHGAQVLVREKPEEYVVLQSSVPAPYITAGTAQTWLMEMPKINPNRQTLHADPQPYNPANCRYLPSDARMLYTPHNIMRWTYSNKGQTYMSNTRVVRWSDGSITLHVGTDVHTLHSVKGNAAVNILGSPSVVRKGAVEIPAMTTAVVVDRHMVVESKEAPSIESALFAESAMHRIATHRLNLAYTTSTLPPIDWSKPKDRNPQEEFVAAEYDRRDKELARRLKAGHPMTLKEQLDKEQELMELLRTSSADSLQKQQDEANREAALRNVTRRDGTVRGNNYLNRELGLTLGDGTIYNAQEENGVDDTDESQDSEDYQTIMREMQQKRQREDDDAIEQQRVRIARREKEMKEKMAPLITALTTLTASLPMDSESFGSVDGVVEFLRTGNVVPSLMEKEIPSVLDEVSTELPNVDLSGVRAAYDAVFRP